MTTITHTYCGATLWCAPLYALGADTGTVFWIMAALGGATGASPDIIGEAEKWKVGIAGSLKDDLVLTVVRRGKLWNWHRWAHDIEQSFYKFCLKAWYFMFAAIIHIRLDRFVHPPTEWVDREKHPVRYWIVYVALECAVVALFTTLWMLAKWFRQ
jgi:hypothetical protein